MAEAKKTLDSIPQLGPLDTPAAWGGGPTPAPGGVDIQLAQREIDSICGTTRDNKSIVKLVWNGDPRYWREVCLRWDAAGEPLGFVKRPIVLYRSVYGRDRRLQYDVPVPRWVLLTRIEPEQYVPGWERDSKLWDQERGRYIQVKPSVPPDEYYVWFMTIAEHNAHCCQLASEENRSCYGFYAAPQYAHAELGRIKEGIKASGLKDSPFDSPDRVSQKLRERSVNDYMNQTLRNFDAQVSRFADAVPQKDLRHALSEARKRDLEDMERQIIRSSR